MQVSGSKAKRAPDAAPTSRSGPWSCLPMVPPRLPRHLKPAISTPRMSPLLRLGLLLATGYSPLTALAGDVVSGQATDLSVTVYRAPGRSSGALSLDSLNGFALVSETRSVSLPPG